MEDLTPALETKNSNKTQNNIDSSTTIIEDIIKNTNNNINNEADNNNNNNNSVDSNNNNNIEQLLTLSRQELSTLNFPFKLWVLINSTNKILKWGSSGSSLQIDLLALDEYLYSTNSIFKIKNKCKFIEKLNFYGFKEFNSTLSPSAPPPPPPQATPISSSSSSSLSPLSSSQSQTTIEVKEEELLNNSKTEENPVKLLNDDSQNVKEKENPMNENENLNLNSTTTTNTTTTIETVEENKIYDKNKDDDNNRNFIEFKHGNFIEGRPDLLYVFTKKKIFGNDDDDELNKNSLQDISDATSNKKCNNTTYSNSKFLNGDLNKYLQQHQQNQSLLATVTSKKSRREDPCHSAIRGLSNIEKARLNLGMILQISTDNYAVSKQLSESSQSTVNPVAMIEVREDAYENPHESISRFEENSEYAGFYGNITSEQIKLFFDQYLPVYAQGDGAQMPTYSENSSSHSNENLLGTSAMDVDSTNLNENPMEIDQQQQQSTNGMNIIKSEDCETITTNYSSGDFQINYSIKISNDGNGKELSFNITENGGLAGGTAATKLPTSIPIPTASSVTEGQNQPKIETCINSLEPIFTGEDDDDGFKDDDISMDDYIKFKNTPRPHSGGDNITVAPSSSINFNITENEIKIEENSEKNIKQENIFNNNNNGITEADIAGNTLESGIFRPDDENKENEFKNFFDQYRETINLLYE